MFICMCCFFFQAEDGIRDLYVTGVQTCALPISTRKTKRNLQATPWAVCRERNNVGLSHILPELKMGLASLFRSEERRVGKECRYRWSSYHDKNNRSKCHTF